MRMLISFQHGLILMLCIGACLAAWSFGCSANDNPFGSDADADGDADADADADADGDADLVIDTSAEFTINNSISEAIPTVGIVEWSVNQSAINAAYIQFGLTESYGINAPVDLRESGYRTLLLGMKPSQTYHFRVMAISGDIAYVSPDRTITTEAALIELYTISVDTKDPTALAGGYTVSSFYDAHGLSAPGNGIAFILDKDSEYVWWYTVSVDSSLSRAKMSADGKYMLAGTLNVSDDGSGVIVKISMDGLQAETIRIPDGHHDFTVLPDNTIAYIEYETDGTGKCDRIVEQSESGDTHVVYTIRDDFAHLAADQEWCHSNAIHYVPSQDAYYLSVLNQNMVIKVDRSSESLVWTLGGPDSDFSNASWSRQHGHCELADGNIMLFNNGSGGFIGGGASSALEYSLNESTWHASRVWNYSAGYSSGTLGDVQRLNNGNTLVTYSNSGLIHEVNSSGELIQSIAWDSGSGIGYADRRMSLYGPPDQF